MSSTKHTNAITGLAIKATNVAALDEAMQARRFAEPKWATFQQWKGSGAPVRPGEAGVTLNGASGFTWRVFNVAQTAGGTAEAARAPAPAAARTPAAPARKSQPSARVPESKKILPSAAPSAANAATGTVTVSAVALREALEWTRRACSLEVARSYLRGVYIVASAARELQLVATDGHRMHGQTLTGVWTGGKVGPGFIMQPETIRDLVKEIGGKPRDVAITIKGEDITVKIHGGKTIKARANSGTFPDYVRVIPQDRAPAFFLTSRDVSDAACMAVDTTKPAKAKGKRTTVPVALDASGVHRTATARPYAYFNPKYLRDMARMGDLLDVEYTKDKPHQNPACFIDPKAGRWGVLMPMVGPEPAKPAPAAPHAAPVDAPVEAPAAPVDAIEAAPVVEAIEATEAEPVTVEAEPIALPAPVIATTRPTWLQRLRAIFRR